LIIYALNTQTSVLQNRSLMMLIPALLLPFAALLAALPWRLVRSGVITLLCGGLLYLSVLRVPLPRSNVRELARLVMAQAATNDLIVITPEPLATSFNYYYPGAQEQLDFPEHTRLAAISYDDWLARTADPARRMEAFRILEDAHRHGRRVWLILLKNGFAQSVPMDDSQLPADLLRTEAVLTIRSTQLLQKTLTLYGEPAAQVLSGNGTESGFEEALALRFDPKR